MKFLKTFQKQTNDFIKIWMPMQNTLIWFIKQTSKLEKNAQKVDFEKKFPPFYSL